jgi:hypothetical protein
MPNAIKYNVSAETLALKKGNFWIGTGDVGKGPTSSTGYYNGLTPPSGGYTIYLNKASGGPSIYTVSSVAQLTGLTSSIAGQSLTTSGACLNWFATQTDKMIFNIDYPPIVTNGLLFNMDAGFTPSYPTTGTSWYDLSNNSTTGTLTNGPTFNSANGGSIVFDGVDDYVALGTQTTWNASNALTMGAWVNISGIGGAPDIGGIITNQTTAYDLQALDANTYGGLGVNQIRITYGVTRQNPNTETYVHSIENKNTWLYAVATRYFDGTNTTIKLYINGILKQTSSMVGAQATTSNTWVLGRYYASRAMIGNIAVAQIYNRELSASEIIQNYEAIGTRYTSLQVQSLIVAGGGAGGGYGYPSGGGGAGGLLTGYTTSLSLNTNYTITVGAGGSSNSNGSNSVFNTLTSIGGGRGGNGRSASGVSGGSGGGGGSNYPPDLPSPYLTPAGSGTVGQGNNGGVGKSVYGNTSENGVPTGAGGGGGAGAVGGTGTITPSIKAGDGGVGLYFSEYSTIGGYPSGWFAGGGGGSTSYSSTATNAVGVGGNGGGGNGSYTQFSSGPSAIDGIVNTGGGGGGAGYIENSSANGGSGIVILKIPDVYTARFSSGVSASVTKSGGYKYYKVTATSTTSETVSFS